MKTIKTLFLSALLFLAPAIQGVHAQQPVTGYGFNAVTGTAPVLAGSVAGSPGTAVAYYVLIANFTGGSIPSNIITVNNVPGTLNSTNFVSFVWLPVSGVVTYDLLKLTSATLPSGTATVVLRAALAATATSTTDQGGSLSSYTLAAQPAGGTANLVFNSRDHTSPLLELDGNNGLLPGFAANGKVMLTANARRTTTDATTTGVTLTAAKMVGGLYFHAPTGAVNDATDTATNIIAALPACYLNTTSVSGLTVGSSFEFRLFNNSAGANTITVTAGTGVTLVGTMTVAQNAVRNFIGLVTACTGTPTLTLYSTGTGTY
jgi:hypothetical protein